MRTLFRAACFALSVALAACIHPHPHGMTPGQAKKSVHVHVEGCGHVLVGGTWIAESKAHPGQGKGRPR